MIKKIFKPLVLACTLALVACQTVSITHFQLSALNKGMTKSDVATKLQPGPRGRADSKVGNRQFSFESYLLNNGVQVDHYVLAYESERLVYWGYISEFRKLQDSALVEAVSIVYPTMSQPQK